MLKDIYHDDYDGDDDWILCYKICQQTYAHLYLTKLSSYTRQKYHYWIWRLESSGPGGDY